MNKIRINYKEGGFSLIWFDKELQRLQMMTAGESIGKTILNIKEQKEDESKPFTFQAYLEHLNNLEPQSNFALWKALDLAKFVRTQPLTSDQLAKLKEGDEILVKYRVGQMQKGFFIATVVPSMDDIVAILPQQPKPTQQQNPSNYRHLPEEYEPKAEYCLCKSPDVGEDTYKLVEGKKIYFTGMFCKTCSKLL